MELSWDICIGNNLCPLLLMTTDSSSDKDDEDTVVDGK